MFTDDELFEILRILSVVLHLGNIQYQGNEESNVVFVIINEGWPCSSNRVSKRRRRRCHQRFETRGIRCIVVGGEQRSISTRTSTRLSLFDLRSMPNRWPHPWSNERWLWTKAKCREIWTLRRQRTFGETSSLSLCSSFFDELLSIWQRCVRQSNLWSNVQMVNRSDQHLDEQQKQCGSNRCCR